MTPGLFLKAAAVVLAAGSPSPASAKVEDMGMLAAPIANGYVDANPASWPSEFDTDLIPAAIIDFQPVEAFSMAFRSTRLWRQPDFSFRRGGHRITKFSSLFKA